MKKQWITTDNLAAGPILEDTFMKSSTKHKKNPRFKNATAKIFSPSCAYYQGGISVSVWKERKGCNLDKILIWKNNSGSLFCISKDIHCLSDTKEFLYPHVLPKRIIHFNLNWHFLKFNKNDLTEFSVYRRIFFSWIPSQFVLIESQ